MQLVRLEEDQTYIFLFCNAFALEMPLDRLTKGVPTSSISLIRNALSRGARFVPKYKKTFEATRLKSRRVEMVAVVGQVSFR